MIILGTESMFAGNMYSTVYTVHTQYYRKVLLSNQTTYTWCSLTYQPNKWITDEYWRWQFRYNAAAIVSDVHQNHTVLCIVSVSIWKAFHAGEEEDKWFWYYNVVDGLSGSLFLCFVRCKCLTLWCKCDSKLNVEVMGLTDMKYTQYWVEWAK